MIDLFLSHPGYYEVKRSKIPGSMFSGLATNLGDTGKKAYRNDKTFKIELINLPYF